MYQETLQFYQLWRLAVQERDEARETLKLSLAELSKLQEHFNTMLLSVEQQIPHYYPETTDHQNYTYSNSDDSPSRFSPASSSLDFISNSTIYTAPEICDSDCYSIKSNQMGFAFENKKDFETVVLEIIGFKRVLPENGKFQQAVIEAAMLVESLFISSPIPKWKNPPVQMLSHRPALSNNIGKWTYGGSELGSGILNGSFSSKTPRLSLMP